ncbi:MAG: hypothetical protein ACYCYA_04305 [Actinomycetes bacterium]
MRCQARLDTSGQRCAYRDGERADCQLTPVVAYGPVLLCAAGDARRFTMGKLIAPRRLPAPLEVDVLAWLGQVDDQLAQAHAELAATVRRARARGHSWGQIGARLGISRQAAQQRFGQDHRQEG